MVNRMPVLAALAALSLATAPAIAQTPGTAAPIFQSTVPALRFVPLQRLPRAPAAGSKDLCSHLLTSRPETPAGRQVAEAGWGVTGEVRLGPYQAVSFVGSYESGTSGSCLLGDGNIGIFQGSSLVAIAYAPAGGKASIARAIAFEQDGLRIWDGDFLSQPVADIRLGENGSLTLQPLASVEKVCGGAASIPNIYGKPIDQARGLLQQSGWSPVTPRRSPREPLDGRVADLTRRGVPEVEDCSGTGFGFCAYGYHGPAGRLSVTTVGDNAFPTVADYAANCGAPG